MRNAEQFTTRFAFRAGVFSLPYTSLATLASSTLAQARIFVRLPKERYQVLARSKMKMPRLFSPRFTAARVHYAARASAWARVLGQRVLATLFELEPTPSNGHDPEWRGEVASAGCSGTTSTSGTS